MQYNEKFEYSKYPYEKFERDITKFQPESSHNAKYWALIEQDKTRHLICLATGKNGIFVPPVYRWDYGSSER